MAATPQFAPESPEEVATALRDAAYLADDSTALIAFLAQRLGKPVLVDLRLFAINSFGYGSIAALVIALGEFGMLFALPLFVQGALGYSALDTGLLVVFLAIGTFLISGGTPQLGRRLGGRAVVQLGLVIEIIAVAGLGLSFTSAAPFWALAGWLFLYGVGVGLATAQLTSVILAEVPVEQSGEASGLQSTVRQLGSALGIALLGTLLVSSLTANFSGALAGLADVAATDKDAALSLVRNSVGAAIPELSGPVAAAARTALVDAARITTLVAAAVLGIGLLATFRLPALKTINQG